MVLKVFCLLQMYASFLFYSILFLFLIYVFILFWLFIFSFAFSIFLFPTCIIYPLLILSISPSLLFYSPTSPSLVILFFFLISLIFLLPLMILL